MIVILFLLFGCADQSAEPPIELVVPDEAAELVFGTPTTRVDPALNAAPLGPVPFLAPTDGPGCDGLDLDRLNHHSLFAPMAGPSADRRLSWQTFNRAHLGPADTFVRAVEPLAVPGAAPMNLQWAVTHGELPALAAWLRAPSSSLHCLREVPRMGDDLAEASPSLTFRGGHTPLRPDPPPTLLLTPVDEGWRVDDVLGGRSWVAADRGLRDLLVQSEEQIHAAGADARTEAAERCQPRRSRAPVRELRIAAKAPEGAGPPLRVQVAISATGDGAFTYQAAARRKRRSQGREFGVEWGGTVDAERVRAIARLGSTADRCTGVGAVPRPSGGVGADLSLVRDDGFGWTAVGMVGTPGGAPWRFVEGGERVERRDGLMGPVVDVLLAEILIERPEIEADPLGPLPPDSDYVRAVDHTWREVVVAEQRAQKRYQERLARTGDYLSAVPPQTAEPTPTPPASCELGLPDDVHVADVHWFRVHGYPPSGPSYHVDVPHSDPRVDLLELLRRPASCADGPPVVDHGVHGGCATGGIPVFHPENRVVLTLSDGSTVHLVHQTHGYRVSDTVRVDYRGRHVDVDPVAAWALLRDSRLREG